MITIELVRQLVAKLLTEQPHEYSARLKQRLAAATIARGLGYFDESAFGYRKFKDFLTDGLSDLVRIERPSSSGDILVSLITDAGKTAPPLPQIELPLDSPPPVRGDVWQAFTNLDQRRKRFLHRPTNTIRHYVDGTSSPARAEVESHPSDFVEISPIAPDVQRGWMSDFLSSLNHLPPQTLARLREITCTQYSAESSKTFSDTLGTFGAHWRRFRAVNVLEVIKSWAAQQAIPVESLLAKPKIDLPSPTNDEITQTPPALISAKERVHKLLELLSDEELDKLVLPVLVSTILIKSRL